jgi:hypothetical protein
MKVCCQVAHWTVSGAPGRAPSEQGTLGFLWGALRYNSPDMFGEPTEQRSLRTTVDCKSKQRSE